MKTSLFSFVAAAALLVATAASAAPFDHARDPRRMSPREQARHEQAQRKHDRARARREAQHRPDRGPAYGRR